MAERTLPADLPIVLSPDDKNEIIQRVAKESAERIDTIMREKFREGLMATVLVGGPREQLAFFENNTYPVDQPYILEAQDYVEGIRGGVYPLPMSPLWLMFTEMPPMMDELVKIYRDLHKRYIERPVRRQERPARKAQPEPVESEAASASY